MSTTPTANAEGAQELGEFFIMSTMLDLTYAGQSIPVNSPRVDPRATGSLRQRLEIHRAPGSGRVLMLHDLSISKDDEDDADDKDHKDCLTIDCIVGDRATLRKPRWQSDADTHDERQLVLSEWSQRESAACMLSYTANSQLEPLRNWQDKLNRLRSRAVSSIDRPRCAFIPTVDVISDDVSVDDTGRAHLRVTVDAGAFTRLVGGRSMRG